MSERSERTTSHPAPATPRDRLLQAAREVVADDGLEGLTLRAIARRAGVSHGAPLRHFPGLASLLAAVGADGFARLIATIDNHLAAADAAAVEEEHVVGPRRRLALAGEAYIRFALGDPGVFSVTFRPERVDVNDEEYQAQGAAAFQQLVDLVEAVQADGWQPDRQSDQVAGVLWAQVHGLAELALHGALGGVVAHHPGPATGGDGARGEGADLDSGEGDGNSAGGEGGNGERAAAGARGDHGADADLPLRLAALFNQLTFGDDPEPPPPSGTRPDQRHEATPDEETTP